MCHVQYNVVLLTDDCEHGSAIMEVTKYNQTSGTEPGCCTYYTHTCVQCTVYIENPGRYPGNYPGELLRSHLLVDCG